MKHAFKYYLLFILLMFLCFTGKVFAVVHEVVRDEVTSWDTSPISNVLNTDISSYTFASSDDTILQVRKSGSSSSCLNSWCSVSFSYIVIPLKSGDVSVYLYDESHSLRGKFDYHVTSPVTGITSNEKAFVLGKNEEYSLPSSLGVRTIPEDADNTKIFYSIDDPEIATIDENGTVTTHNVGSTYITATTEDGGFVMMLDLEVIVPAETISIDGGNRTYTSRAAASGYLSATVTPDNVTYGGGALKWESTNADVIGIDHNGVLTINDNGVATISACTKYPSDLCDSIEITAENIITSMYFSEEKYTLTDVNQTMNLSFEHNEIDNMSAKVIRWVSSDENVVTVDSNGKVTAVGYGTATISVYCDEDYVNTSVEVEVLKPIKSVILSIESTDLIIGNDYYLSAEINPDDTTSDKTLTWTSSDPMVATVDENGHVVAYQTGTTTIRATSVDGPYDECTIEVKHLEIDRVELSENEVTLLIGESQTVTATIYPSETTMPTDLTWASGDENVASVSDGTIVGLKEGTTEVTVTTYNGKNSSLTVDVLNVIPVYRMYNPVTGEHLYTTDAYEVEVIYREQGWGKEGIGWYSASKGTAVYRLYNPRLGNHLYTSDLYEISVITTTQGWVLDFDGAPVMYSYGNVPIYRLFNPGLQGQHHLTTDFNEYNVIPMWGWQQEGVAMNAVKVGVPETTHYYK